jgi:hypothetical protein
MSAREPDDDQGSGIEHGAMRIIDECCLGNRNAPAFAPADPTCNGRLFVPG